MEPSALAGDMWGVIGLTVTTAGTIFVTWLTLKTKRGSDREDQDAKPVIEEAEKQKNLQPVVDHLLEQVAALRVVAAEKYPASLGFIRLVGHLHPETKTQIPHQIRADL